MTVGLEIHAELATDTKIFCGCPNRFGGQANTRVCPVCLGMPGALPVLNRRAVELAVKAGLAFSCRVSAVSRFDRKHYFYPDLPKAYQITQFFHPLCRDGFLELHGRRIGIERIHLEEDAGKLLHDPQTGRTYIDYNRCGVPLIEMVTRPDIHSPEEARDFVAAAARRLRYAGVCDGRMEQGSLRCDVNLSVGLPGEPLGVRTEMKNLSSLRAVSRAVEAEYRRQIAALESGGRIVQETRRFDETDGVTYSLRAKQDAHDYRYFPEPDLPSIRLEPAEIAGLAAKLPEPPEDRVRRYLAWGIGPAEAELLCEDKALSDFYDCTIALYPAYKAAASLILTELRRCFKETGEGAEKMRLTPAGLAGLVALQETGRVSKNGAREVLRYMYAYGGDPEETARREGYLLADGRDETRRAVEETLEAYPQAVEQYRGGKGKALGFLMGQTLRRLGRSANPVRVRELLTAALENEDG
ncbi:MAG: Asp-tRNA(Asn)/Glu-tRNA(Gln) amidotransferase subunit GatB [Clostridiales bacterium]|nr:Asp-tRNA(Asn)/Glu-tRNA(Gln) amidotransferase subunit GatB [Clostridiales bacterium]